MNIRPKFTTGLVIIVSLIFFSCDTTAIIDLPKNPPKLTLNCIGLNTQAYQYNEGWRARITLSTDILKFPEFPMVQNATVSVYENGRLSETLSNGNFHDFKGWQTGIDCNYGASNLPPLPGNEYRIEVSSEQYGTLSSSYVQPQKVVVDSLEVKIIGPHPTYANNMIIQFNVTFADPPGENYYQIEIGRQLQTLPDPNRGIVGLDFTDPAYKEANEMFPNIYSPLTFTDVYFNGEKTSLEFESTVFQEPDFGFSYYTVYLSNITKEYYFYLKGINLQGINLEDPFAQPVKVENNIQNGFGIFTGYTQTVKYFKMQN